MIRHWICIVKQNSQVNYPNQVFLFLCPIYMPIYCCQMSMHSYSISKNSTLDLYKAIKINKYYFTFHTRTHKALEKVVRCDTMTIQSSKLVDYHSLRGCDYLARVVSGLVFSPLVP